MFDRIWSRLANAVTIAKLAKNFGNGGSHRLGGVKFAHTDYPLKF